MPTRIKKLNCRVTVRTGAKTKTQQQTSAKAVKPDMNFAMPQAEPRGEGSPEPSQTATEERGQMSTPKPAASPAHVDPQAVADRVYELMAQELRHGRTRGL